MICRPTNVEPVKAILRIRGCLAMAAPAVIPYPVMMLTTPGGKPASRISSASLKAESGVFSAVLRMQTLDKYKLRGLVDFIEKMRY